MTGIQEIAARICEMPVEFRRRGDVSMVQLVAESGYDSTDTASLRHAIEEQLRAQPKLIGDWLTYSTDKRTGRGWYLKDGDVAVVGYYHPSDGRTGEKQFADRAQGCADFIMHELEGIHKSA